MTEKGGIILVTERQPIQQTDQGYFKWECKATTEYQTGSKTKQNKKSIGASVIKITFLNYQLF